MLSLKSFFNIPTMEIAKNILGCYLIHQTKKGIISGKIVETEAYLKNDSASHSFKGKTQRNSVMFGPPGRAYIYFTYGMHYCFNIATENEGIGEAILIRSLEPIKGIELMKKYRKNNDLYQLCSGPAKLVQALAINKSFNNHDLTKKPLFISINPPLSKSEIIQTTRIGISKGISLPHRFYIKNSPFVSKK